MKTYRLGLDLGSTAAKAALIDSGGVLLGTRLDTSGKAPADAAHTLAAALLAGHGIAPGAAGDATVKTVATGYGRAFAGTAGTLGTTDAAGTPAGAPVRAVTEITCHARGVRHLHPDAAGILDIGGQDAKAIRLDADGTVADFAMNDRCAAGTGRFLEVAAQRYGLTVADLSAFCGDDPGLGEGVAPFEISSTCVVFAESELVGLNAKGMPPQEALRAVHRAIARRTVLLLKQANVATPLYFTGGVAQNETLRRAIAAAAGVELRRADHAQFTGALGAALLA